MRVGLNGIFSAQRKGGFKSTGILKKQQDFLWFWLSTS